MFKAKTNSNKPPSSTLESKVKESSLNSHSIPIVQLQNTLGNQGMARLIKSQSMHHQNVVQRQKVYLEKDVEKELEGPELIVGSYHEPSFLQEFIKNEEEDEELGGYEYSLAENLNEYLDEYGYGKGAQFRNWDGKSHPKTGWKFHVSANLENELEVAEGILPLLRKYEVTHKVDVSKNWGDTEKENKSQIGKFITIYPSDDENTTLLADLINRKLIKMGLSGLEVPNEYSVGNTNMLYMRHGQLSAIYYAACAKDGVIPNDGKVNVSNIKDDYDVIMGNYDNLYSHKGILHFMKGGKPAPAMLLGNKLIADPREGANPANVELPKGLIF